MVLFVVTVVAVVGGFVGGVVVAVKVMVVAVVVSEDNLMRFCANHILYSGKYWRRFIFGYIGGLGRLRQI